MIKIKGLSKSFGKNEVLKDVDLEFSRGNIYGVVGENGAGKSTLFRCIAGLEDYDGEVTADLNPIRTHLGLLLTEPYLFKKITGEEYIKLLCTARNIESLNIKSKNIFDLPLNQYASTYSTGMKKKLALTGILLQENEYFILDEPFNGVDIQSNIILTEIILKLKSLNKIVIISSHVFSSLSKICDEIYLLRIGEKIKHVPKTEFDNLENEMRSFTMGERIDRLGLK